MSTNIKQLATPEDAAKLEGQAKVLADLTIPLARLAGMEDLAARLDEHADRCRAMAAKIRRQADDAETVPTVH